MSMFKDMPVDVGVIYEGERIRKQDLQVELGGPKVEHKFELVNVKKPSEIKDGEVQIIGPDLNELKEGNSYPIGVYIEVSGKEIEEDLEGIIERRIHEYCNYIEGFMHLNQRYDIWMRLSKKSYQQGLNSFKYVGKILEKLYKSELPIIQKIQTTFILEPKEVQKRWTQAMEVYNKRDARARGLKDEEADSFYGCTLCQSFAPTHVCVITPQRYANCGAISWFDGRAASRVDPKGPLFKIDIGDTLDTFKGEYSGANEALKKKSLGEIEKVWLYTAFGHPHTSCGCFEAIAFYVPEVDGLGIVHRDFKGVTVNGLPFSTLADSTAGGRQVDGFHGLSIEYMRSPKFLIADGGWERIAWLPKEVKERVGEFIPKDLYDKIPTEDEVKTVEELKAYLQEKQHPIVERWKQMPVEAVAETAASDEAAAIQVPLEASSLPLTVGGFRVILKDAKITAKKVIIRKIGGKK